MPLSRGPGAGGGVFLAQFCSFGVNIFQGMEEPRDIPFAHLLVCYPAPRRQYQFTGVSATSYRILSCLLGTQVKYHVVTGGWMRLLKGFIKKWKC